MLGSQTDTECARGKTVAKLVGVAEQSRTCSVNCLAHCIQLLHVREILNLSRAVLTCWKTKSRTSAGSSRASLQQSIAVVPILRLITKFQCVSQSSWSTACTIVHTQANRQTNLCAGLQLLPSDSYIQVRFHTKSDFRIHTCARKGLLLRGWLLGSASSKASPLHRPC